MCLVTLIYYQLTYWRSRGIPYRETLPILGVFSAVFFRQQSLAELVHDLYYALPGTKYFGCLDFGTPTLFIKDPEMIREIGVKSFDYFPNHRSFVEEDFDPILAKNLFSLRDDRWREMRTILSPSFTASKMKYIFQLVSKVSTDFVRYLREHPEIADEMDMKDVYTRYTNDVIATVAFGISVDSMKDRDNEFYTYGKDVVSFDGFTRVLKFMAARIFPKFMRLIGQSFLSGNTDRFFKKLVYDTVRTREEKGIVRPDMIHLLLQAKDNEKGIEMTNEDIIAQAFIFFFAGFDTSARLMCFVSHVLAYHPEVQERLRNEVDDTLAGQEDENISYEKLAKMKYLDMVISETLRLYPPMPFTDRVCVKKFDLPPAMEGGMKYTVMPNTSLWIPVFAFHRDPKYFEEPEKFDPERFNDENKNDINPYTYIPFGVGPRKCVGERFALMEAKILLTHLLRNFVLTPSEKTRKEIVWSKKTFDMRPDCGFWIKLQPRKKE